MQSSLSWFLAFVFFVLFAVFAALYALKKCPECGTTECPGCPICPICPEEPPHSWFVFPGFFPKGILTMVTKNSTNNTLEKAQQWVLRQQLGIKPQDLTLVFSETENNFYYGIGIPSQAQASAGWELYLYTTSQPSFETV